MARLIRISYSRWTNEDKEIDETDQKGWLDEEGVEFRKPSEAIKFLRDNFANTPSTFSFQTGIYYESSDTHVATEVETVLCYHLYGFTARAERMIWEAITQD